MIFSDTPAVFNSINASVSVSYSGFSFVIAARIVSSERPAFCILRTSLLFIASTLDERARRSPLRDKAKMNRFIEINVRFRRGPKKVRTQPGEKALSNAVGRKAKRFSWADCHSTGHSESGGGENDNSLNESGMFRWTSSSDPKNCRPKDRWG